MKFKIFIILFMILLSNIFLNADVIKSKLFYTQDYDSFRKLVYDDFNQEIVTGESRKIKSGNLAILIEFKSEISHNYLSLYVNNHEIDELYYMGNPDFSNNRYSIEIKSKYLVSGKNNIEFVYYNNLQEEIKNWNFMAGNVLSEDFSTPIQLTDGPGRKRSISISPDGRFAAYVVSEKDANAIKLLVLETRQEKTIEISEKEKGFGVSDDEKFFSFTPIWSRTGDYIFYVSTESGFYEIYRSDVSMKGDVSNKVRVTNLNSYCADLSIHPVEDKLYFASRKDDKTMGIYVLENAETIKNSKEAENNIKLISDDQDQEMLFAPAISSDGTMIAYCSLAKGKKSEIVIRSLEDLAVQKIMRSQGQDSLYPAWSPQNNILAYLKNRQIFLVDAENNFHEKLVASDVKIPSYAIKPSWDPSGKAIYYIKNNVNNSISQVKFNLDSLSIIDDKDLLNDRFYRDNAEVSMSPAMDYLIYNSFKTGVYQLWALRQESKGSDSYVRFIIDRENIPIKLYSREKGKYQLLALSPYLEKPNSFLEKEKLPIGVSGFKIAGQTYMKPANALEGIELYPQLDARGKFNYKPVVFSTLMPGAGQKVLNQEKKGKMFFWSLLGLAASGTGTYLLSEAYYDDYMKSNDLETLADNRNRYNLSLSITNGLITTGIILYSLNIFDAIFSSETIPNDYKKNHQAAYLDLKSDLPQQRVMHAKKNRGTGELKIFVNQPKVDIFLKGYSGEISDKNYYGRTNFSFDRDTYFTIDDLDPGAYQVVCKKDYFSDRIVNVTIDEYNTTYAVVNIEKKLLDRTKQALQYSVPGYTQFTRNQKVKGYTISALAGSLLLGALVSQVQTNNDLKDYNNSCDVKSLIQARENYYKHSTNRDTFLVMLGLTLVYNFYDAISGEQL